jgi:hypothetical protein
MFTNETLKKAMDSKVKEKYLNKGDMPSREEYSMDEATNTLKGGVQSIFAEEEHRDSILQSYKKQITGTGMQRFSVHDQMRIQEKVGFIKQAETHFSGSKTEEDFMKKSRNVMDAFRLRTNWSPLRSDKISDEYLKYDKFEKNYIAPSSNDYDINDIGNQYIPRKPQAFMSSLNPDKREKLEPGPYDRREGPDRTLPDEKLLDLRGLINYRKRPRINIGQVGNKRNKVHKTFNGRLSPQAREHIYQLYRQGATVRDLSIKFGILPERVKAVVWMKQIFYEQVVPRIDLTTMKMGLEREALYAKSFGWVDYGLDLVVMAFKERGVQFQRFRKRDVDINTTPEQDVAMLKLLEKKRKKNYDHVIDRFMGKGQGGYYLKSWIVYRRQGAERVTHRFKQILLNAHSPHKMSLRVQKRLHLGPRAASKGYGIT